MPKTFKAWRELLLSIGLLYALAIGAAASMGFLGAIAVDVYRSTLSYLEKRNA